MKVAVVGSRNAVGFNFRSILHHLPEDCTEIISGGACGIDSCAQLAARECGVPFYEVRPDYAQYGKKAPLIRNLEIVRRADLVLAFWDFQSRGTAYTVVQCIREQVPVRVIGLGV